MGQTQRGSRKRQLVVILLKLTNDDDEQSDFSTSSLTKKRMENPAYEFYADDFDLKVTTRTIKKVRKYDGPEQVADTGSKNGKIGIFSNVCGMLLAIATLPLGLYQEISIMYVRQNETLNSIQKEVYNVKPSPVHLGMMTDVYVYTLVSQLICLLIIALLVLLQRCTNIVL